MILPLSLGFIICDSEDVSLKVRLTEKPLYSFELISSGGTNGFEFFFFDKTIKQEWLTILESILKNSDILK